MGWQDTCTSLHNVPTINNTNNIIIRDVIGNKSDNINSGSLVGLSKKNNTLINSLSNLISNISWQIEMINKSINHALNVKPTLRDGVDVRSNSHVWELGDFSDEIIREHEIESEFRLYGFVISEISHPATYELVFYGNRAGEITRIKFHIQDVRNYHSQYYIISDFIKAGMGISAKLASSIGESRIKLSLLYSTYK